MPIAASVLSVLTNYFPSTPRAKCHWKCWRKIQLVDYRKYVTECGPQFSTGMAVSDAALILRCREQNTETAFSTRGSYLGDPVRFRIDLQEPVKEVRRQSMNGRAPFGTHPVDFIGALPDSGRVFIRSVTADGSFKDGTSSSPR